MRVRSGLNPEKPGFPDSGFWTRINNSKLTQKTPESNSNGEYYGMGTESSIFLSSVGQLLGFKFEEKGKKSQLSGQSTTTISNPMAFLKALSDHFIWQHHWKKKKNMMIWVLKLIKY